MDKILDLLKISDKEIMEKNIEYDNLKIEVNKNSYILINDKDKELLSIKM